MLLFGGKKTSEVYRYKILQNVWWLFVVFFNVKKGGLLAEDSAFKILKTEYLITELVWSALIIYSFDVLHIFHDGQ